MIAGAVMIIIATNMIIAMLVCSYLMDLILNRFKAEDKFDDSVTEHICSIYDIITYNGLVKPINDKKKERKTYDNRYKQKNFTSYRN